MARGPIDFWNDWAPQILVLFSFALQLVLLFSARMRRKDNWIVGTALLWLAYQLADSTAIFAIGHLSLCNAAPSHHLVAFWAPFLLLHLGGPDNITAYSLEDSKLWARHLVILIVQVVGAAYVVYKQFYNGSGSKLLLVAVLMFGLGFLKYVERTKALKNGSIDNIRSSIKKDPPGKYHSFYLHDKRLQFQGRFLDEQGKEKIFYKTEAGDEEYLVRCAHSLFHVCKCAFADDNVEDSARKGKKDDANPEDSKKDGSKGQEEDPNSEAREIFHRLEDEQKFVVMGIELSLMYDILYTKASVIHSRFGYSIRAVSPLITAGSLLVFLFSGKGGQNTVDVAITYVLLTGAFLLEVNWLLIALGSSWTFTFVCAPGRSWLKHVVLCRGKWQWFRRKIVSFHHLWNMMGISRYYTPSRRWSESMGQYNMLYLCTRLDTSCSWSPIFGGLAKRLDLEELWETYYCSGKVELQKEIKEMLFKYIALIFHLGKEGYEVNTLGIIRKTWGEKTLQRWGWELDGKYLGAEFHECITIWHIATELFLVRSSIAMEKYAGDTVKAIRALSNYMMFLLVKHPEMLPGLAQKRLYQRTRKYLVEKYREFEAVDNNGRSTFWTKVRNLISIHDNENSDSWHQRTEKFAKHLLNNPPEYEHKISRICYAVELAEKLIAKEGEFLKDTDAASKEKQRLRPLQLLLEIWTDFLVYAANRCSRESHAKKLSDGGELTTVIWLLTEHHYQFDKNRQ